MEEMQEKVFVLAQSCPFWEGDFCSQVIEYQQTVPPMVLEYGFRFRLIII